MYEDVGQQDAVDATLAAVAYAGMQLPNQPALAPWLIVVELGDSRLQLRDASSAHTLTHPLLTRVFRTVKPLLDGEHTVDEIVSSVDSDIMPTTVLFLLKLLQGKGLLQPRGGEKTLDEDQQVFWRRQILFLSHFVSDALSAQSGLAGARVGLVGSGELSNGVRSALRSIGIQDLIEMAEPLPPKPNAAPLGLDLLVACADSPAVSFFDAVNSACLASGSRWLRVCIAGTSGHLGPMIVPHQTACYTCLELRLRSHETELDGYLAYQAQTRALEQPPDEGCVTALWSSLAAQAALEVLRLLVGYLPPVTVGRFFEFTAASPIVSSHDVLKVPRCASCGRRRTFSAVWDQGISPTGVES